MPASGRDFAERQCLQVPHVPQTARRAGTATPPPSARSGRTEPGTCFGLGGYSMGAPRADVVDGFPLPVDGTWSSRRGGRLTSGPGPDD